MRRAGFCEVFVNPPLESIERFAGGLPVQVNGSISNRLAVLIHHCHRFTLQRKQARLPFAPQRQEMMLSYGG